MSFKEDLLRRGREYAQQRGLNLGDELGSGVHGSVFLVESQPEIARSVPKSAIKMYYRDGDYRRERDVYFRLQEHGISNLRGCRVPRLLDYDDTLWIIEMSVVSRPFVLDFAGAYLDRAPEFSDEVLADWRTEKQEQFASRWGEVQAILRDLESYGVFMIDVNPGNISWGD